VILGAVGTAALFEVGKFIISYYIGKQGLDSTYGASASIVVVLIWVYYSAQILCSVRNSLMLALSRDRASLSSETWSARQ
jgi:hypothetical protein